MKEIPMFKVWVKECKRIVDVLTLNFNGSVLVSRMQLLHETGGDDILLSPENITLIEYTRKRDKNDERIWSHNILKTSENETAIVLWEEECASWGLFKVHNEAFAFNYIVNDEITLRGSWDEDLSSSEKHYEVIGNIFYNPELMKASCVEEI